MSDQRLLASIALFRELYDGNKNIYDILAEFIRATILFNSSWSFNSVECTQALESTFGFYLPEAVVKSCLKTKLVRSNELILDRGIYRVTEEFNRSDNIRSGFDFAEKQYEKLTGDLMDYVDRVTFKTFPLEEKNKLVDYFNKYLLGENIPKKITEYCSGFIIENQGNEEFKSRLNKIEEGCVLYAGIKHSTESSFTGMWKGDLTVYLDTELLFSAAGLNGVLFKRVFDDFYSLIKEINSVSKKGAGRIHLRYFEEAQNEVDRFFYAAQSIVEKGQARGLSKTAMNEIVNGCGSGSDVLAKKAAFLDKLRRIKIEIEERRDYYASPQYNLESSSTIAALQARFNHKDESVDIYSEILKSFTKINCLRSGNSLGGLEQMKAIFMTAHGLTQSVAYSEEIYSGNGAVPFATSIDYMIEKLWIRLNKGFGGDQIIPATFNAVTKAQLVLSSSVSNQVAEQFKKLTKKLASGEMSQEQAAMLSHELRSKTVKPEEITANNVGESICFINENFIEQVLKEKSLLEAEATKEKVLLRAEISKGKIAIDALEKIRRDKIINEIDPIRRSAKRLYYMITGLVYLVLPVSLAIKLAELIGENDTPFSVVMAATSLIPFVPLFKYKLINQYCRKLSVWHYKKQRKKMPKVTLWPDLS